MTPRITQMGTDWQFVPKSDSPGRDTAPQDRSGECHFECSATSQLPTECVSVAIWRAMFEERQIAKEVPRFSWVR